MKTVAELKESYKKAGKMIEAMKNCGNCKYCKRDDIRDLCCEKVDGLRLSIFDMIDNNTCERWQIYDF